MYTDSNRCASNVARGARYSSDKCFTVGPGAKEKEREAIATTVQNANMRIWAARKQLEYADCQFAQIPVVHECLEESIHLPHSTLMILT